MRNSAYILVKDGEYLAFQSEKAACEYLGVAKCSVASCYRSGSLCKGYSIIKAKSELDIYMDSRLWKIWESMHERCEYEKHPHYNSYGGRGVVVCDEWSSYLPFAKWAKQNGYKKDLTIDRIDNDGNYEPQNCRWATVKEQQNNKRTNRMVNYQGKEYTLTQLAELVGIGKTTLKERLNLGWSVEDAVTRPVRLRTRGYRVSNCGADMRGEEG